MRGGSSLSLKHLKLYIKFTFFSAINAVLGVLIYSILLRFVEYIVAYSIAYVFSIANSYYLQTRYVFKAQRSVGKAFVYPVVYVAQYVLCLPILYILVSLMGMHKVLALCLASALTLPVTYSLSRFIVTFQR